MPVVLSVVVVGSGEESESLVDMVRSLDEHGGHRWMGNAQRGLQIGVKHVCRSNAAKLHLAQPLQGRLSTNYVLSVRL